MDGPDPVLREEFFKSVESNFLLYLCEVRVMVKLCVVVFTVSHGRRPAQDASSHDVADYGFCHG